MGSLTFLPMAAIVVVMVISQGNPISATFFHYEPYGFNRHLDNFRQKNQFWHELFRTNLDTRPYFRFFQPSVLSAIVPPSVNRPIQNEIYTYRLDSVTHPPVQRPRVPPVTHTKPPTAFYPMKPAPMAPQPIPEPATEAPVKVSLSPVAENTAAVQEITTKRVEEVEVKKTTEIPPVLREEVTDSEVLKANNSAPGLWTTARIDDSLNEIPENSISLRLGELPGIEFEESKTEAQQVTTEREESAVENNEIEMPEIGSEGSGDDDETEARVTEVVQEPVVTQKSEEVEVRTESSESFTTVGIQEVEATTISDSRDFTLEELENSTTFDEEPFPSLSNRFEDESPNTEAVTEEITDSPTTLAASTPRPRPPFDLVEFILNDIWNAAIDFQRFVDALTDPLLLGLNVQLANLQTLIQNSRNREEVTIGDADRISNSVLSITTHISLQRLRSTLVVEKKQRLENLAKLLKLTVATSNSV